MVTPLLRSRAKAVNFGIVYGIGAFSLAKDIGVTNKEAKAYIDGYLSHFSGVAAYMNKMIETARKRAIPKPVPSPPLSAELASSNHMLRAFGERVARNMPIQGTARGYHQNRYDSR
jgi:DNA polymerase-1